MNSENHRLSQISYTAKTSKDETYPVIMMLSRRGLMLCAVDEGAGVAVVASPTFSSSFLAIMILDKICLDREMKEVWSIKVSL